MFTPATAVVAQGVQIHGALDPWLVLVWLGLMAGCLLAVIALTAVVQLTLTWRHRSAQRRPRPHRGSEA